MRQAASAKVREHRAVVALAVTVATLLVLAIVILPPLLAGGDDTENDVRSTLLQGLAGLFLAAGLYFTAQTLRLNREGQITERFTRAIDQLGDEKREIRLGGIYALERIARNSKEDHGPIMEILTAYVRLHAPWPPRAADEGKEAGSAEHRVRDEDSAPPTDVQAVIAVLGRRVLHRREHLLDLSSVDLRGARFGKGADERDFALANFRRSRLERADLHQGRLWFANFEEAYLTEAELWEADLTRANLTKADLQLANLMRAILERANFGEANLTKATLSHARLTEAKLVGANLTKANLTDAFLMGASFMGADLTGATLMGAVYDSETTWPAGFDPEAEGARLRKE